jgi:hypothetical protein
MMQVVFALFADAANLSQEGKLNILGVFDALQVASFPAVHPRAHLVVHLKGNHADVGHHALTLRWLDPQGGELWSSTGELEVGAPPPSADEMDLPFIAQLDLPIAAPGAYTLMVALDDQPLAYVHVHVRQAIGMSAAGPRFSGMVS